MHPPDPTPDLTAILLDLELDAGFADLEADDDRD